MEKENDFKIEDLGYDQFFESKRLDGFSVARVASEHRGLYEVVNQNGRFLAKITGKQMFDASSREDYPAVGDWVMITELGENQAVINGILPRKTVIKRKYGDKNRAGNKGDVQVIGTNIDVAFVVESVDSDYSLNRFERYFAILKDQGIVPVIILNKTDLVPGEQLETMISEVKERFDDVDVISTSVFNDAGLDQLRMYIEKGKTYCFLGSSGVGKSSLINKLIGEDAIKTGEISGYSGKGKHTTTSREMYFLKSGGIVIDNPGIREVGVADVSSGIEDLFEDIIELGKGCRYNDCTHVSEPGCVVLEAVKEGKIDEERYNNYINIKKESDYYEMSDLEKREKDRNFGKFIKRAKEDLKKYE
ncbi:MAG: ribosome small subunit-dependent GTPase A [Candidatus Pacebacteria bacterium]|nr:ribosome small subunit-dependent GTPase A [Candidatus Paceibacterota bacterium]